MRINNSQHHNEGGILVYNGQRVPNEELVPEYVLKAPCDGKAGETKLEVEISISGSNNCIFVLSLAIKKICRGTAYSNTVNCREYAT
eukprot:m.92852 g.92852  ORF g.92852 m.92852 type:complete len:87 (+) comp36761_c0_seq2:480-740(+)